ncbi:MAG: ATP-grasp domain-containing protein [Bacilli bacterium]|nr:ATP-grasp domain-containing protein [Bacilli bacterium]
MISGLIVYNVYDAKCNRFFINKCLELLNDETFSLKYVDEEKLLEYAATNKVDFVIYRGRNYRLLDELEENGIRSFNNVLTNRVANDKYLTYKVLKEENLPYIETYLEPKSFPCIMKSVSGHGGQEVFFVKTIGEVNQIKTEHPNLKFIFQEFLENNGDVRIYVLNKKAVVSIKRKSQVDYRNNYSLGGEVTLFEPSQEMVDTATKIASLLKADFIGVDFLLTKDGYKIIELEDPVGSRMVYKLKPELDIIKQYVEHIKKNI